MPLVTVTEAAQLVGVSHSTIRNYIKDKKLSAFMKQNRLLIDRDEMLSVFSPKRTSPAVRPDSARVIAVANQKGGVGKTTSAVAIASLLALHGPTLALDCDPQGNMTQAFGYDPDSQDRTLYNVLVDELPLADILLRVEVPGELYLSPSNLDLADVWRRAAGKVGLEALLKTAIQPLLPRFQYILLDCPPSLDMTTINCLVAATEVIVPVDMSLFSVRGMVKLQATIGEVRKVNPDLPEPRILACRTEHTTVSETIEGGLRDKFGGEIFKATIPKTKDVPASQFAKQPLPVHAPRSKATRAYESVVEEIRRGK